MAGIADYLKVEIALTTAPFAASPSWTDITSQVRGTATISRGISGSFRGGFVPPATAKITVDNQDGRWDPSSDYASAPYSGNVERDRLIRISCSNDSFVGSGLLFTGFLDDVKLSATGRQDATATLMCSDALRLLEERKLVDWERSEEMTGTRLAALLTEAGIPNGGGAADFYGTVDAGTVQMPANTYSGSALSAAQEIARAEDGLLYAGLASRINFLDRFELAEAATKTTSQFTLTNAEILYGNLAMDIAGFSKVREVAGNGDTGNVFMYNNGTSGSATFPATTEELPGLATRWDADVEVMVERMQKMWETPDADSRLGTVRAIVATVGSADPVGNGVLDELDAQGLDLWYRVTVQPQPVGYGSARTYNAALAGMRHTFSPEAWYCDFDLLPYDTTWRTAETNFYTFGATLAATDRGGL